MFRFFRPLLAAALAVAPIRVHGYSGPGACSGACWAHDPAVIRRASDGLYFKFNTGTNLEIATSSALSGPWTLRGSVLTSGSKIDNAGRKDLWAPDVSLVNGVYHLYYSVSTFGTQESAIGLATSTTLDPGSWTDNGAVGITSTAGSAYNAIDANLIKAGDTYLMNFGSFWNDIYQVRLNAAATKTVGEASYQLQYEASGTHPCEGSYMFSYSGYYYLTWSRGVCCGYDTNQPAPGAEYKIMMCRSKSATGAFVDRNGQKCTASGGSPLLESHDKVYGPGGQGVFYDDSKGLVLYYHYANTDVGLGDGSYLFGWNALTWSGGWPSV
ncbi:unnamed protein product [Diplocarpon coronariae]|uniref:Arabinan endo-1,5-alpha-L-arabinosidase n=1 Tax=Diplocarpon coronariae TaxID=2795749 RepID=A0A218YYR8_9HELO|nr:arabinan endo-1:5-alpha-L-arabinosidase C [Diplocarpon mali]OWP00550.1 glycoside hydrolase, family [Marssonina coronariae]